MAVILNYCTSVVSQLPQAVFALDADRIGNCIYYHTMGHGTGFYDDLSLSDADNKTIDEIFDRYNCEATATKAKLTLPLLLKRSPAKQATRKTHASLTRPKPSNSPATTLGFLMRYRNPNFRRPIMTIRGLVSNRL